MTDHDDRSRPDGVTPTTGSAASDPFVEERAEPLSLQAQLRDAVRNAGIGQVAPGNPRDRKSVV